MDVLEQFVECRRGERNRIRDDGVAYLLSDRAQVFGCIEIVANLFERPLNGRNPRPNVVWAGNVIDEVHIDAIVDDDVLLAVLRVNLLPELNPAFETVLRKIQSFGEGRGGERQYCNDYFWKPQLHVLSTAPCIKASCLKKLAAFYHRAI